MTVVHTIRHGHYVKEELRGIVLYDESHDGGVIDRSRPIVVRYMSRVDGCGDSEWADIPLEGGQSTVETFAGALWLSAKYGLKIKTEEGTFTARLENAE